MVLREHIKRQIWTSLGDRQGFSEGMRKTFRVQGTILLESLEAPSMNMEDQAGTLCSFKNLFIFILHIWGKYTRVKEAMKKQHHPLSCKMATVASSENLISRRASIMLPFCQFWHGCPYLLHNLSQNISA